MLKLEVRNLLLEIVGSRSTHSPFVKNR